MIGRQITLVDSDSHMDSTRLDHFSNSSNIVVYAGGAQFELKKGSFLKAAAANTSRLKHHGTRVIEGWSTDVDGNVFD